MEKFTVLFKDGAPRDWRKAADVAAAACVEIPEGEFVRGCRKDCGLIRLDLIEAQATEIAGALSGAGNDTSRVVEGPDFEHSVTALLTRESLGYV